MAPDAPTNPPRRLVLLGSDEIALPAFRAAAALPDVVIVAVYSQPDRPAGRGQEVQPNPVTAWARAAGHLVRQPERLGPEHAAELAADGSARVVLEMAPTGNRGAELRNMLASEPARRTELVEDMLLRSFGKARVVSQQASEVDERAVPVTLTATFEAPEVARKQGSGLLLPGAIGRRSWVELASAPERRHRPIG